MRYTLQFYCSDLHVRKKAVVLLLHDPGVMFSLQAPTDDLEANDHLWYAACIHPHCCLLWGWNRLMTLRSPLETAPRFLREALPEPPPWAGPCCQIWRVTLMKSLRISPCVNCQQVTLILSIFEVDPPPLLLFVHGTSKSQILSP